VTVRARRTSRGAPVALALAVIACGKSHAPPPGASAQTAPVTDAAPPGRDEVAERMAARLRRDGRAVTYDRAGFTLVIASDGGHGDAILSLGNLYAEYITLGAADRDALIERWATSFLQPSPVRQDLATATPHLVPIVRSRLYFDGIAAQAELAGQAPDRHHVTARPLGDLLAIGLAIDAPTSLTVVEDGAIAAWGTSWDRLDAIALANLRRRSAQRFVSPQPGVYVSPWHDAADASRLLLPDLVDGLQVRGRLVALTPTSNLVILTGDEDPDGLTAAADLAEQAYQEPHPIDLIARCRAEASWSPCIPSPTPAIAQRYLGLRETSMVSLYQDQKALLDPLMERRNDDVFVANDRATRDARTGAYDSVAVLTTGVPTLLPRAARIALVDSKANGGNGEVLAVVPWERLFAQVGSRWHALGMAPERYRVDVGGFPTAAELAALGAPSK
jgi:uncharacterized protein YtpQ (UPF0354 family)